MIFSPFAGIWRHTILESQLIQAISKSKKIEITSVGCGGLFPNDCTVRSYLRGSMVATPNDSKILCEKCTHSRQIFSKNTSARTLNLDQYSHLGDSELVDSLLLQTDHINPTTFLYEGLPLGSKALYEIILKYKKRTVKIDGNEIEEWKSILRNSALVVGPALRLLAEIKPDVVITYNAQYAIPGTFADIAVRQGINTYSFSGSSSPVEAANAIRIWNWEKYKAEDPALHEWPGVENLPPLDKKSLARYSRHEQYISTGKSPWTYSQAKANKNPRKIFKIPSDSKIVLAVINSEDEIFAARIAEVFPLHRTESKVFPSQGEWIEYLIRHYRENPKTHLIIRLHPREFPNKRENRISEQARIWEILLKSLPPNIHLDHPDDGFSLYDYFEQIDVLTTGWSSTAIESLARGIPVVTYDRNILGYPHEEILTGLSIEEYKKNLDLAETLGSKEERIDFARKWVNFSLFEGSVYLGGGIQDAHLRTSNPVLKFSLRGLNRILNLLIPGRVKKIDLLAPRIYRDDKKLINLILSRKDNLYQL